MTDLRKALEEFYEGFNAGDFDRAFSIFADDVITVEPALGKAANLAVWREYDEAFKAACPDANFIVRSIVQDVNGSPLRARFVAASRRRTAPRCGNCSRPDPRSTWSLPSSCSSAAAKSLSTASTAIKSISGGSWESSHDVRRGCFACDLQCNRRNRAALSSPSRIGEASLQLDKCLA
jgi:hypothetical protein